MTVTTAILIASLEWKSARARRGARPAPAKIDWDAYARREPISHALTFGSNEPRPLAEETYFNPRLGGLAGVQF